MKEKKRGPANNIKQNGAADNRPMTVADKKAYIAELTQKGRELDTAWRKLMEHSTDRVRDNERSARACDNFFVADYWIKSGDLEIAISYMEETIRSLTALIKEGATTSTT